MTITIYGNHTAPYGDFPYSKREEFERALKQQWDAVTFFNFNAIDMADVMLDGTKVVDLTVRQIHERLAKAVKQASVECSWDIWSCPAFEHIPAPAMSGDQARALLIKVIDELRELPNELGADLETGSHHSNNAARESFARTHRNLTEALGRLGALTSDVDLDQLREGKS